MKSAVSKSDNGLEGQMLSKLVGWSVVVIGLLLAGVQKGSADQIYACKDNTSGILYMYATPPSAGCGPGRTLLNLTFGPGSALGGSSFACVHGTAFVGNGGPLAGSAGKFTPEDNFGSSGISYANGTTFLAQPGVYLVQLSIPAVTIQPANAGATNASVNVQLEVPPLAPPPQIFGQSGIVAGTAYVPVNGNQLLQISAANSVVDFRINATAFADPPVLPQGCQIVFTRLQ
jgi:hypothetical protein